ncbi:MAG: hypothetical protein JRI86_10460 [Deltaproteobacteria bacterium]|nr:hypothetical protein [Deltaproteobacteria bacterium]
MKNCVPMMLYLIMLAQYLLFDPLTAQARDYFPADLTTHKYAFIFAGAAAEEKYARRFQEQSLRLYETLITDYGYQPNNLTLLSGQSDPEEQRISGPCRQETIKERISALSEIVLPGDQIFIFLVGHGTNNGEEGKFNIVGPDMTGRMFAELLGQFSEQDIIVVNTTGSSYPFATALSSPGRVIISATRSRAEKFDTIFPQLFIEALENHAGDRDKNGRVSMWEAFLYGRQSVEKWYDDKDWLPSEHPCLDDNGDGLFNTEPDPTQNDGRLAQIAYMDVIKAPPTSAAGAPGKIESQEVYKLTVKTHDLERSISLLRNRKTEMTEEDYWKQMESLLIEFARANKELRSLQGDFGKTPNSDLTLRKIPHF